MVSQMTRPTTDRACRATAQADRYLVVPASLDTNDFLLIKRDGSGEYTVNLDTQVCTCPDHQKRGTTCKHYYIARRFAFQNPHTLVPTAPVETGCIECGRTSCDCENRGPEDYDPEETARLARRTQALRDRHLWD